MFSVMIPCFRPRLEWLKQTIESVRPQLTDADELTVVDASGGEVFGVRDVIRREGGVYRHTTDRGGVALHNDCIALAKNRVVHLLHPDDWMLPGFYESFRRLVTADPDFALYCGRAVWCDETGRAVKCDSPRPVVRNECFLPLHEGNPLCVAACLVTASAYKEFGGWDERLVHTADWECWARTAVRGGACDLPYPVACYRMSPENDTAKMKRTGENVRDRRRLLDVTAGVVPVNRDLYLDGLWRMAKAQGIAFGKSGDAGAAANHTRLLDDLCDDRLGIRTVDWFAPSLTYRGAAKEMVGV